MENPLRKVTFKNVYKSQDVLNGYFHLWGKSYFVNDTSHTEERIFGLIEDEEGNLHKVLPTYLTFTGESGDPDKERVKSNVLNQEPK